MTNALAAPEDDISKSRGLVDAENVAIMHRESTRLAEKQGAMAVLSQDIAALTAAGEPMGKFVDKFAELSVLAAEVDALQKLPPRIEGEHPDDLAASIAAVAWGSVPVAEERGPIVVGARSGQEAAGVGTPAEVHPGCQRPPDAVRPRKRGLGKQG